MPSSSTSSQVATALIVGASRGLGLAIVAELLGRDWAVIATARRGSGEALRALAGRHDGRLTVEQLDIDDPQAIADLRDRLASRKLDILFVNAGTTTHEEFVRVGEVETDEFVRVMITNALSPMRVIEGLQGHVPADGLLGAMSSGQGSIGGNERGMREVYRMSKAALNMAMRSFAAREAASPRAMILMAPGWIRTDLGGPDAPFTLEESVPKLVDLLIAKRATPGLEYLDRDGKTVPW